MAAPSVSDAFANVPVTAEKTTLQTAAQTFYTAIGAATTYTTAVKAEMQDEFVRFCRILAENLIKTGKY